MKTLYPTAVAVSVTKRILIGLAFIVAGISQGSDALATPSGASAPKFTFRTAMLNTGVDPDAKGIIDGNLNGPRLQFSLANLNPNTTYQLAAFLYADATLTSVTEFTTDAKGAFRVRYGQRRNGRSGGTQLPEALSQLCNVLELRIVNGIGQTILRGDLTNPDKLQYLVNRSMNNTGFIPAAVGSVRIKATQNTTQFRLRASGLTPVTDYVLTIDGRAVQTNSTDASGSLKLTALPPSAADVLAIQTLALADHSGTNVVLIASGLGIPCDSTAPTVSSTIPAGAATGVPINGQLAVTFSEPLDPLTITTATFTLVQGTTSVTGTVTYIGVTAIFNPATNLVSNTNYTATITTGVRDLAGNPLAADFIWNFTTGVTPDATAPAVSSTIPVAGATNVTINSQLSAIFSEAMDPLTVNSATFTLKQGVTPVTGTVSYVNGTASFAPATSLTINTLYTATITTGATDLASNALATNSVWSFTTGAASDIAAPTIIGTNPTNTAINVAINQTINATFNKALDPLTISTAHFTVTGPGAATITGTVAYVAASRIASFTPTSNLAPNTTYTNTITTGIKDLAGNTLATNFVWSFTTGTQIETNLVPIVLGRSSTFAILATAAISGGGNQINGDVGVNPGSAQGIAPSEINGTIHVTDQTVIDAQTDLTAAYADAVNRTVGVQLLEGNLGGLTKTPGLYENGSSSGISGTGPNAILTLDAQGDANAVFIFKMASTLITDPGTSIVLSGGAQAKNVYWQVGSSATLDTTTIFKGNVLAAVTITVNNGAAVEGRLFAGAGGGAGSVTVQSSTITVPAP